MSINNNFDELINKTITRYENDYPNIVTINMTYYLNCNKINTKLLSYVLYNYLIKTYAFFNSSETIHAYLLNDKHVRLLLKQNKRKININKTIIDINMRLIDKILNNEMHCNIHHYIAIAIFISHMNNWYNFSNLEYTYKSLQLLNKIGNLLLVPIVDKDISLFWHNYINFIKLINTMTILLNKIKNIPDEYKELFNNILLIIVNPIILEKMEIYKKEWAFMDYFIKSKYILPLHNIFKCLKNKTLTIEFKNILLDLNYHNTLEYNKYFNNKDIFEYLFDNKKNNIKDYITN